MEDKRIGTGIATVPDHTPATAVRDVPPADPLAVLDVSMTAQRQSFDLESPQGRSDVIRCKGVPDFTGLLLAGRDLVVRDWLCHIVELEDQETGEVYRTPRLVLLCVDGTVALTTSPSLIRGWSDVLAGFGRVTFSPPITVRVKAVKAKRAGQYLLLESVSQAPPPESHPKKK